MRLAASCLQAADDDLVLPPPGQPADGPLLACRRIALADGALIWIAPAPTATSDGRQLLIDQLDLAQEFGRMGLFERDLATGAGRWDRHVHRIYGLDAERDTPGIAEVMSRCVHPDDRAALQQHFQGNQTTQGRGSVRFASRGPTARYVTSIRSTNFGAGPTAARRARSVC